MNLFGSVLRNDADRQGFWYSSLIGVFLGLLVGSALTSILGIIYMHNATQAQTRAQAHAQPSLPAPISQAGFAIPLHRGPLAPVIQGFTDQNGHSVTTADLLGKVRVVTFVSPLGDHYTPLIVTNLMNLFEELKNDGLLGKRVVFVSYNVDPSHTGPGEMAAFLRQIAGLNPATPNWRFLTANPAVVHKLVSDGYGVHYRQLSASGYATFAAKQREDGNYLYATATNPLTGKSKPNYHVVDHDEMFIVGPRDHIWLRIHNASTYSDGRLMRFIATLLRLPGMPGIPHH